jgi:hypothetical protein
MSLKHIRLELARDREFPGGNPHRGYEFQAPLDADGRLAPDEFAQVRQHCTVTRFWDGERTELGRLARTADGQWVFDYDDQGDEDDEPGYRFGEHHFVPGEYVSVREHDGVTRTFRVASVQARG